MRKLAILVPLFTFLSFAQFAFAQQGDAMFGGNTLLSSGSCDSVTGLCPEKGGFFPSFSGDVIFHRRIGVNFETAWRGSQGSYEGQPFRPITSDFNLDYQPHLGKKLGADLLGGIGWQSTRFYLPYCTNGYSCDNFTSEHNFLVHLGGGVRYYVWNHVFVRPEIHYYHIINNTNIFSSNEVFRVGASVGYTIGGRE